MTTVWHRKLFDTISIYPGAPGMETVYHADGGAGVAALKLPRSPGVAVGPGRITLEGEIAFEHALDVNLEMFHWITMLRATEEGWTSGAYRGHGAIAGLIYGNIPRFMIESWGPVAYGGPGGHFILDKSKSPRIRSNALYRWRVSSTFSANGFKFIGYALWQHNQVPLFDTGDCEDNNADVDMTSDALYIGAHFQPRLPLTEDKQYGSIRLSNVHYSHTPDCDPRPDLRGLW